jgi:hypothetical protein
MWIIWAIVIISILVALATLGGAKFTASGGYTRPVRIDFPKKKPRYNWLKRTCKRACKSSWPHHRAYDDDITTVYERDARGWRQRGLDENIRTVYVKRSPDDYDDYYDDGDEE